MIPKYNVDLIEKWEDEAQAMLRALATDGFYERWHDELEEKGAGEATDERYKREFIVANGGFGTVESVTDRRLSRTVARKRLRPGAPPLLAREIRILSRLQHPNILPLYEANFAENGRPEGYTMPLLTGESLRDLAKRFHANRPAMGRLRLAFAPLLNSFEDVCRAIGYAHSRGVWHLDIKGANVLVDASGAAVVIDWNMALTEDDPPDANRVTGTPGFQSPEQASAGIVGPATDIHGLGALLYELLTGQMPYGGGDREQRVRRARAGPPDPPSHHWPAVPKALEAICQKAMSPNPRDRFQGADELRIEVNRWRNDEAVQCYPEPSLARLARWGRRHPKSTGILLTLVLATLPILMGWLAHVDHERRATADALAEARANFAEVLRAGDRYFTTMSDNRLLQGDGLQSLRQSLLADGLAFYQEFLERRGDTPELRREIAVGWAKLAWLLARDESRSGAAPAARRALEMLEQEQQVAPSNQEILLWTARTLIVLAEALEDDGRTEEALTVLGRFEDWRNQHASELNPQDAEWIMARAQSTRASVLGVSDPAEALEILRTARAIYERIAARESNEENQFYLASILTREASLAMQRRQLDESRSALSRAGQIYQALLHQPDPLPTTRRGMSTVQHLLGLLELQAQDFSAAREHLLGAYQERHALVARNPDNKYLCHQASTAFALARLYRQTGPKSDAEHWLLLAHRLLQQCIDDRYPNAHLWKAAVEAHARAGWLLLFKGQFADAATAFRAGCDVAKRAAHSRKNISTDR